MRHISARFAPFPPSSGFIVPSPSVLRPKRYTNLPDLPAAADFPGAGFAARSVLPDFAVLLVVFVCFFCAFFAISLRTPLQQSLKYHPAARSVLLIVSL